MRRILTLSTTRPAAVRQPPLPPFDRSDSGGLVHTTSPPELVVPRGSDLMFMRADFNGVTLNPLLWPNSYFQALGILGANSTPYQMIMTPMLILYPRPLQDAVLTAHAQRGYTHFIIAPDGWNLAANNWPGYESSLVQWAQYIKSWGFYVVLWRSEPVVGDSYLRALLQAGCCDWYIAGEEVDGKCSAQDYAAVLDSVVPYGIPIGAHCTADYPDGFPRDTFFDGRSMPGFNFYNGKVHLMWQANQNESAGTQGAKLYYARQRVNLGGVGGNGELAPDSRVYAFETMATAQLFGHCDEAYGNLRDLELMYATRDNPAVRPMAGYGNGCRLPNGDAL